MIIVINGGTKGIGRATALKFAETASNKVIITGRDAYALKKLSETSENQNITPLRVDITKGTEKVSQLIKQAIRLNGGIDVLINSSGRLDKISFAESDLDTARGMMESNFFAPVMMIKNLLGSFNRGAHIVNIGSMGGFQGSTKFPGMSWYSASKAALACMTECLAAELSEHRISLNCICPGAVQTEMLERAFPGYNAPITADDMADFLVWFAFNGHKFYNGKVLPASVSTP